MADQHHDYSGRRVTVMGLGRFGGGVGVARFLASRGADVLVTDMLSADELAASVAQLDGVAGVSFRLGEHNVSDFTTCDLLVVNPAVKPGNRFVRAAQAAGVEVTSEIRLLVRHLPGRKRTIGVTGSAGKSTVTAMIGHVLDVLHREGRSPRAWVGGNIGGSLLERLGEIAADDWVVLELSSFMLEGLRDEQWSPHIAVVTNVSPNHLDWHGTIERYIEAKRVLFAFQCSGDTALVGESAARAFDRGGDPDDPIWHDDESIDAAVLTHPPDDQSPAPLCRLPGLHNRLNATFARAVVEHVLIPPDVSGVDAVLTAIDEALLSFPGLPHRLQPVGEHAGVRYFNDSKSTTPEAARLAIEAFDPQTVRIILGGSDKGSDLGPLARFAAEHCVGIYTIGTTGDAIAAVAEAYEPPIQCPESCGAVAWPLPTAVVWRCGTLDTALDAVVADAKPGENVVLSPGCASWDQFAHYEARGHAFVARVNGGGGC